MVTTRSAIYSPISLHGRRVVLRTMNEHDYEAWYEVRTRCRDWLLKWEPRSAHASHLAEDHRSFVSRCAIRERERQIGTGFGFGIFVEGRFVGEITLSSIQRGPLQSAYIGYWIDEAVAGQGLMPEAVVTMLQYAFESLRLHRVEINIIEESNPRLLAFQNRELDYVTVPPDLVTNVLGPDNKLKPEWAKQGIVLAHGVQPAITYTYFNMDDPVVGGYSREKIALRRAISMAYNVDEEIRVLRQGQAEPATQPIPPNVAGYDPNIRGHARYDPAGAKALLDKIGYIDRDGDGWRDLPDGKPLKLMIASDPSALARQYDELWQRSMSAVGIRVEFVKQKWPDLLKMARYGQLQMWALGNINTTPEGFGFMSLLYGPHAGFANLSRFNLPEFNQLYVRAQKLPDGPERAQLFAQMSELVNAYAPWLLEAYRYENILVQPWVLGYKYTVFDWHPWRYYDIDLDRRNAAGK